MMMNLGEKMTELECDALVDVSKQCTTDACDFYSKTQFVTKLDLDICLCMRHASCFLVSILFMVINVAVFSK